MFLVDFAGTYLQNIAGCDMIKKTAPDVGTVRHCLHTQFNNPVTFPQRYKLRFLAVFRNTKKIGCGRAHAENRLGMCITVKRINRQTVKSIARTL